ncbi:uncharacterized protein LOC111116856 [Crassostrea virginica]
METWAFFLAVLCYGHFATEGSPLRIEWTGLDDPWGLLKILRTGYNAGDIGERVSVDGQDQYMEIENLHQRCSCPGHKPIGCECKEKIILQNDGRGRFPKSNDINSQANDVRQLPFTKRQVASQMPPFIEKLREDNIFRVAWVAQESDYGRRMVEESFKRLFPHLTTQS